MIDFYINFNGNINKNFSNSIKYIVLNLGKGTDGLSHYKIEIPTTAMTSEVPKDCLAQATAYDALDGNGQLFLGLQEK